MGEFSQLSRRERQIMDILYTEGQATVRQVQAKLPDPPTDMAVRRMLQILEEKGHVVRQAKGREVVYLPAEAKARAGLRAFKHVLDTFFGGAVDEALAVHLASKESPSPEQLARMRKLIEQARKEGR